MRVVHGALRVKDKIIAKSIGKAHSVDALGVYTPKSLDTGVLKAGEVGYVISGIKDIKGAPVGDTFIHSNLRRFDRARDEHTSARLDGY